METKHTPGPWTCHSGSVYQDGPNVYPKGQEIGIPIARMDREAGNGTYGAERDANARLIAAAPELLGALDNILGSATNDNGEAGEHELRERMRAVAMFARAAIAKARGK